MCYVVPKFACVGLAGYQTIKTLTERALYCCSAVADMTLQTQTEKERSSSGKKQSGVEVEVHWGLQLGELKMGLLLQMFLCLYCRFSGIFTNHFGNNSSNDTC